MFLLATVIDIIPSSVGISVLRWGFLYSGMLFQ